MIEKPFTESNKMNVTEHYKEAFFNLNKSDYATTPLFLGERMGLIDTIDQHHSRIDEQTKRLKALDWGETDFSLKQCRADFNTNDRNAVDVMLYALATQSEADSIAARHIVPILAPVLSSSALFSYYVEEQRNEVLHARVYSNVGREAYEDPAVFRKELLKRQEALSRLVEVVDVFSETQTVTARYLLGEIPNDQKLYNQIFKFIVAKYVMERLMFTTSFGATFALTHEGWNAPVGLYAQKINQDELEVHSVVGEIIIDMELMTDRGVMAFAKLREWIIEFVNSVIRTELNWNKFMHQDGRYIPNVTQKQLDNLVFYNAAAVCKGLGIPVTFDVPKRFPIPLIEKNYNISLTQGSPQEVRGNMYMVGEVIDDLEAGPMTFENFDISKLNLPRGQ